MSHDPGELLETYSHGAGEYRRAEGTDDWQHVVSINSGGGYEWSTLHAFYSPSARRYFWSGDTGCSCNSWGDDLGTAADFDNGDKDALKRALRQFVEDYSYDFGPTDLVDALDELAKHRPTN